MALPHCPVTQARWWSYPWATPFFASLIQSTWRPFRNLQDIPWIHPSAICCYHLPQPGKLQLPNWAPGFRACLSSILLATELEWSCKHVNWMGEATVQRFIMIYKAWRNRVPVYLTPASSLLGRCLILQVLVCVASSERLSLSWVGLFFISFVHTHLKPYL